MSAIQGVTMYAPGFVTDLGASGQRGWDGYFDQLLNGPRGALAAATGANGGVAPSVLLDGDPSLSAGLVVVDWPGYPVRVRQALDRPDATLDPFIDWTRSGMTFGRSFCHEEYLEWRSVRQADGKLVRLEFTTETPDYWARLARFEPRKVVELAARFAGEQSDRVDVQELFGISDPFGVDPMSEAGARVEQAYARQNLTRDVDGLPRPPRGAYNNGAKAIMHMANGVNSTGAAVTLAVFAAYPHGKRVGGQDMALSGPEAITATAQSAVDCRNSDPTIVGRVLGTVFAGSKVALMDPFGIYIVSSPQGQLTLSDGAPVPDSWFSLQRGTHRNANPVGRDLFQRLVIQAPPGSGMTLNDLLDSNGNPIETGTQVARLINVGLMVRASSAGAVTAPRRMVPVPQVPPCDGSASDNDVFREGWAAFEDSRSPAVAVRLRTGAIT